MEAVQSFLGPQISISKAPHERLGILEGRDHGLFIFESQVLIVPQYTVGAQ